MSHQNRALTFLMWSLWLITACQTSTIPPAAVQQSETPTAAAPVTFTPLPTGMPSPTAVLLTETPSPPALFESPQENSQLPAIAIEDPALFWKGEPILLGIPEANSCLSLSLTAAGQGALGVCDGLQGAVGLTSEQFAQLDLWQDWLTRLASFETETPYGRVVFHGQGTEIASPAWQRALAAWAKLAASELNAGRSGAGWAAALAWQQSLPDRPGYCQFLSVQTYGWAYASTARCEGGDPQNLGQGWIDGTQWEQFDNWFYNRMAVTTNNLSFFGVGTLAMSEAEMVALEQWSKTLYHNLTTNASRQPPSTPQCRVRADLLKLCTASSANLRSIWTSPYEHLLTSGVVFSALARSLDGAWLQVQIPKTAQTGWVPAGSPLLDCGNLNIAALPVAATIPDVSCSPIPTTDIGVVASLSAIEPGSKDVTLQIERADEGHTFFIDLFRLEITDNNGKRYTFDYGIPGNDGWRQQFSSDSLPYPLKGALTQPIDPTATQVTLSLQIDRAELGIPYVLIWQQALTPLAPATPVPAVVPPEGPVEAVFVSMPYLFLGQGASLVILDPSLNPAQPAVIGAAVLPPETRITAIATLGYYDHYVYVMADGLRIFDISNPTQPVQVGFYQPPQRDWAGYITMTSPLPPPLRGMDVAVQNTEAGRNYAYIAAWAAGLRIVDVTDPVAPVEVGSLEFEPNVAVTGIALGWQIAYLSTTAGLRVVDVSDPTRPVQIGALPAVSWDVAYDGGDFRLYLVEGQCSPLDGCVFGSLQAIDASDPANPRLVEQAGLSYSQVVILDDDVYTSAGDYNLYVATRDGLLVFRSTDLSRPVGQWPPDSAILIRDMTAIGDYLYLAAGDDGLKILNVAEATAPTEVGEIPASLRQPAGQPPATPLDEPTVGPEPTEEPGDNP